MLLQNSWKRIRMGLLGYSTSLDLKHGAEQRVFVFLGVCVGGDAIWSGETEVSTGAFSAVWHLWPIVSCIMVMDAGLFTTTKDRQQRRERVYSPQPDQSLWKICQEYMPSIISLRCPAGTDGKATLPYAWAGFPPARIPSMSQVSFLPMQTQVHS